MTTVVPLLAVVTFCTWVALLPAGTPMVAKFPTLQPDQPGQNGQVAGVPDWPVGVQDEPAGQPDQLGQPTQVADRDGQPSRVIPGRSLVFIPLIERGEERGSP